jgi:hypothetical protein
VQAKSPKETLRSSKEQRKITFRKLSKKIAEGSTTISDSDVLAVLNNLTKGLLKRH